MRDDMRRHVGRPVMVQLDVEDESIGGTLDRVDPMTLTLSGASLTSSAGTQVASIPLDGVVVISRFSVLWVQVAADA